MAVWRKRESRDSEPGSRWPAYDLGRDASSPKVNAEFSFRGAQSPRWKILELILPFKGLPSKENFKCCFL